MILYLYLCIYKIKYPIAFENMSQAPTCSNHHSTHICLLILQWFLLIPVSMCLLGSFAADFCASALLAVLDSAQVPFINLFNLNLNKGRFSLHYRSPSPPKIIFPNLSCIHDN